MTVRSYRVEDLAGTQKRGGRVMATSSQTREIAENSKIVHRFSLRWKWAAEPPRAASIGPSSWLDWKSFLPPNLNRFNILHRSKGFTPTQ